MLCSKLSFLQGFPCKLALSSVRSILEHGCPQNDPSPIPLSELNWSRAGLLLGSRETRLLCRLRGTRAVPHVARCEDSCRVRVGWPDPSPGPLGSAQQLAFKSQTSSCVFVTCLQPNRNIRLSLQPAVIQSGILVPFLRRPEVLGERGCQDTSAVISQWSCLAHRLGLERVLLA